MHELHGLTPLLGGCAMRRSIWMASLCISIVCLVSMATAQQLGGTGSKAPTNASPGRVTNVSPGASRQPVFYVGKVVLDSGTPPPAPVAILRVCNGIGRRETFTGADGSFSFMVGDRLREVTPDGTEETPVFGTGGQVSRNATMGNGQGNPQSSSLDCELRAELAGYSSTSIRLDPSASGSVVGIIMLHSRGRKSDGMVTVASLAVPAKARREFEKGSEQLEKENWADAEKSLRKAVDLYPNFAEAWTRLGDLEQRRNNPAAARQDYEDAITADPSLPLPYLRMAFLEVMSKDWEQAHKLAEKFILLDPTDSALAYYYNGVAEFNLNQIARAESSALRAESMDKLHAEPRIELLLASIYVAKDSYSTAADHYRAFLALIPQGPLSDRVKTELAKIEQLAKSEAPPVQANK